MYVIGFKHAYVTHFWIYISHECDCNKKWTKESTPERARQQYCQVKKNET